MGDKEVARAKESWFDHARLSVMQCMSITCSFYRLKSYETTKFEAATDKFPDGLTNRWLSRKTICDSFSFAREIIVCIFYRSSRVSGRHTDM